MSPAAPQAARTARSPQRSPGPYRVRVVRGQEGVRECVHREDIADVDQPVRQFQDRDENAGQEAERKDDGQGDRLAASMVLTRLATAKPRQEKATAPTRISRRKAGAVRPGICAAKGGPADGEQDSGDRQDRQGSDQGA